MTNKTPDRMSGKGLNRGTRHPEHSPKSTKDQAESTSPEAIFVDPADMSGFPAFEEAKIRALAQLDPLEFARRNAAEAASLGVPPFALDRLVQEERRKLAKPPQNSEKLHRRFSFAATKDMAGLQEPTRWIVKSYIEAETLCTLFAPAESLKTFVILDMGLSIASGKDWHGRKVGAGPVLYICGEGRRGITRRVAAWERYHDAKADLFFISNMPTQLLDTDSLEEMESAADEVTRQHGAPSLVIIDTLNRNFGAGDENSTSDMTRFVAALDRLRERLHCAIVVVHHTGLADSGRGRGNSALRGALDFEYLISRSPGEKIEDITIELACSKCKDHDRPPTIAFRPVVVDLGFFDEEKRPVTSLALKRTEYTPKQRTKKLSPQQRIALEALQAATKGTGKAHIEDWRDHAYRMGISDNAESKRKAFNRTRTALLENGSVQTDSDLYWLPGQSGTERDIVTSCHGDDRDGPGHIPKGMSRMSRPAEQGMIEAEI